MEHKLVEKPAMKFEGIGIDTTVQNAPKDCKIAWANFMKRYKEIKNYIGGMKNYGVSFVKSEKDCEFRYVASAEVSEFSGINDNFEKIEVPASKYLIFTHKGKLSDVGKTYWEIMQFIQKSKFKQQNFWIEFYDHRWKGDKKEGEFEIWIAIED